MITGAEIGMGVQALKAALNIAKDAKDLTDTTAIRGKIIEMQSLIMEAQVSAIDARDAHSAQVQTIRKLEEEMARLKAWGREKEKYELKEIHPRSFAYAIKADAKGTEPSHLICANCYEAGEKRILQQGDHLHLVCPNCKSQVQDKPRPPWPSSTPTIRTRSGRI